MALVLQSSIDNNRIQLFFDVVNNRVLGAQLINGSDRAVVVNVDRSRGNQNFSVTVPAGVTETRSFPGNQRFDYDTLTAEWSWGLTMAGP